MRENHDLLSRDVRSRTWRYLRVFILSTLIALLLQWIQAQAFGGNWTGLLGAGGSASLAPTIQKELGEVIFWEGIGHDGQMNYGIARDLSGEDLPGLLEDEGYRYRRIFYPFVAGMGGVLGPKAVLTGLILWAAIGMGMSGAGLSMVADAFGLNRWVWLAGVANPGLWLSVQLLTVDALAHGLAVLALGVWFSRFRSFSLPLFALASLTKEQYALIGIVLGLWLLFQRRGRESMKVVIATCLPVFVWSAVVSLQMGGGLSPGANFDWPLRGIVVAATSVWPQADAKDIVYTVVALTALVLAVVGGHVAVSSLLRWMAWSWATLAITASAFVWGLGNNASRAFAPVLTFGVIAIASRFGSNFREHPGLVPGQDQPSRSRRNLPV
jgi:hypothetical protein